MGGVGVAGVGGGGVGDLMGGSLVCGSVCRVLLKVPLAGLDRTD